MDARAANDRIAEKAKRLHFLSRVPMLCECNASGCHAIVMVFLDEYAEIRRDPDNLLTAPGHEAEGTELASQTSSYAIRRESGRRREGNGDHRSA